MTGQGALSSRADLTVLLLAGSSRAQIAVGGAALGRKEQAPCHGTAQSLPQAGPTELLLGFENEPPSPQLGFLAWVPGQIPSPHRGFSILALFFFFFFKCSFKTPIPLLT